MPQAPARQGVLDKDGPKDSQVECFFVTLRIGYDVMRDNGEKIEFNEIRNTKVKRPSCLKVRATRNDRKALPCFIVVRS